MGGTVWIEGEVLTQRDLDRITKVLESYPEVRSLVELSPMTQQMMDRAQADSIKTVQLDVTIMEVDKTMMRSLGVKWAGSINPSSALPFEGTNVGPISGVICNILPSINMMTSTGKARVLAQPTLITRSGQKAQLFVGGELPIPVAQGGGAISIEYKEYGVKLEFEPKVDTQDNIDTVIFVEMSSLGGPAAQGGAPGLITNRVTTNVFVQDRREHHPRRAGPGLGRPERRQGVRASGAFRCSETSSSRSSSSGTRRRCWSSRLPAW